MRYKYQQSTVDVGSTVSSKYLSNFTYLSYLICRNGLMEVFVPVHLHLCKSVDVVLRGYVL